MILGISSDDRRLENRIRPARIRIDSQKQRIGREPAKIDDAIHDRLRRVRNFNVTVCRLIDEIGELGNLLKGSEDQIDRLVDVVFYGLQGDDTGLSDPPPQKAPDIENAPPFWRD